MDKVAVLVTGVGGALGVAIIKSLRMAERYRIIGVNSLPWGAGLFLADRGVVVPPAASPEYIPRLIEIIREENVKAVLCGTHHDLLLLSKEFKHIERETNAKVIVSPTETLMLGYDKWATVDFLRRIGCAIPKTSLMGQRLPGGFPVIVKPRCDAGSRGVVLVHDRDEFMASILPAEQIVQEYLEGPEYTVGGFWMLPGGLQGLIAMRRELAAGVTQWAEVDQNPDVLCYCQKIIEELKPYGPCNIQLRLTERGPVAFEINVRFSTTTVARAHFGFNEVDYAVRRLALGEKAEPLRVKPGFFTRHWEEIYRDAIRR